MGPEAKLSCCLKVPLPVYHVACSRGFIASLHRADGAQVFRYARLEGYFTSILPLPHISRDVLQCLHLADCRDFFFFF